MTEKKLRKKIEEILGGHLTMCTEKECVCETKEDVDKLLSLCKEYALRAKCPRCNDEWIIHDCPYPKGATIKQAKEKINE